MDESKQSFSKNPKDEAGFFSLLFITWMNSLLKTGFQRTLKDDDLHELSHDNDAEELTEKLTDAWEGEVVDAKRKGKKPRLWRAVVKMFSYQQYVFILILIFTKVSMDFTNAVLLWLYLKILEEEFQLYKKYAIIATVFIGIAVLIRVFVSKHHDLQAKSTSLRLKVALIGIIHKKILKLKRHVLSEITSGGIQNLISNDVQRMEELFMVCSYLTVAPFMIVMSLTTLMSLIGWQSLSGVQILLIPGVLVFVMGNKYAKLRITQALLTDKRLGIINEIISGIRSVKTYAWEQSYINLVNVIRRQEAGLVIRKSIFYSLNTSIGNTIESIATLISIITLIYAGIELFSYDIFTLAVILGFAKTCIKYNIDYCYRYIQDANISLERIEQFLCKSEMALERETSIFKGVSCRDDPGTETNQSLLIKRLSAAWSVSGQNVINDITLMTKRDELIIMTGPVGSGKSSLLMAIQEEIPITSGTMSSHGKIAYVSQVPWVFSGTVRDNIVFGKSFNEARYKKVLDLCDLQKDMRRFPNGDLSMIGQRGITLSGGQRSRVSLARAVYSDADIILLDDPLSAVDAKVGQHIFDKCICGELSGRTRILVTHQLQYLHRADWIVILKDGYIEDQGSYDDLKSKGMIQRGVSIADSANNINMKDKTIANTLKHKNELDASEVRDFSENNEERAAGHVTWRLYWSFFRAGSHTVSLICYAFFYLIVQATIFTPNLLQTRLANMSYSQQRSSSTIGLYTGLVLIAFTLCIMRDFICYYFIIKSSKHLHGRMTEAVIKTPGLFFDTNPIGRIMNRFSRDIGIMDDSLPRQFDTALSMLMRAIGVVILAIAVNLWLLLVVIPLLMCLYYVAVYYLTTSRELSRMVAIRYSPVYDHIGETIRGLEVIRTSQMEYNFVEKLNRLQNRHTKAFYLTVSLNQWFALRFDLICAFLIIGVASVGMDAIEDEAITGMLLTLTMGLIGDIEYGIRMACEVENKMTSVERVMTYCSLPAEPGYSRQEIIPENWPNQGMLRLQDVSLQYVEDGVRVLKNINLLIQPQEKIGVVGRTGAGKSSLVAAILRMPEPRGHVFLDGVDLGTINIQAARKSIAVISQDPILFSGSLRRNLDPFNRFTDRQIWTALEEVELSDMAHKIPGQLEYCIGEFGTGFSVGERQLLCLARALLERRQIMIMDEATANVDYKTDQLIQQVIRDKFNSCTVLTIAHRINTIMDYDRVIVMDHGHVIDFDTPGVLAGKKDGIFYEMLEKQCLHLILPLNNFQCDS